MRIILIRHGDPDYEHDSLTEKGRREALLLARRTAKWKVDDVYVSPLGRARETAQPSLAAWGKEAEVLGWAQEFFYPVSDGKGGKRIPWDFFPAEWTNVDENFCENDWVNVPLMQPVREHYHAVCRELDGLLARYGYEREGRMYRVREHSQKTAVIFCHFGVSMIMLSRLLNLPAQALLHGIFLAPTSVTVLSAEERRGNEAYFRAERIGDCAHLLAGGEPVSASGYFSDIFQEV